MIRLITACVLTVACSLPVISQENLPSVSNSLDMQLNLLPAGRFEMGAKPIGSFGKDHGDFNAHDAKQRHQVLSLIHI